VASPVVRVSHLQVVATATAAGVGDVRITAFEAIPFSVPYTRPAGNR